MIAGRDWGVVVTALVGISAAITAVAVPGGVDAQEEVTAVLRGQVRMEARPVPGQVVHLHQVSSEIAAEIDSVATNAQGEFRLGLPHVPDPERRREVFFASTRFSGILYFGAPISQPADLDSAYVIEVYDTVSAPERGSAFPVQARSIFAEQGEGGWTITDLFEIRNDGARTVVGRPGGVVWTYPLLRGAETVELGDGDLSEDAFGFADGSVSVLAPVPPGTRLFVFRYEVPDLTGGLPLPGTTDHVEVLVREPAPPLQVEGLTALASVEIEPGTSFRRFASENTSETLVRFSVVEEPATIPFRWLVVGVAMALAMLGVWATLRPPPVGEAEALIEIAKLDEAWDASGSQSDRERSTYERRRRRLIARVRPREPR